MGLTQLVQEHIELSKRQEPKPLAGQQGGSVVRARLYNGSTVQAKPQATAAPKPGDPKALPVAISNALDALTKYIPTEVLAIYIPVLAALPTIKGHWPSIKFEHIYAAGIVLTPIIAILIFAGKRVAELDEPPFPRQPKAYPWGSIFLAIVAFAAWAFAIPGNPNLANQATSILAGLTAVVTSAFLTLLAPIVMFLERKWNGQAKNKRAPKVKKKK